MVDNVKSHYLDDITAQILIENPLQISKRTQLRIVISTANETSVGLGFYTEEGRIGLL